MQNETDQSIHLKKIPKTPKNNTQKINQDEVVDRLLRSTYIQKEKLKKMKDEIEKQKGEEEKKYLDQKMKERKQLQKYSKRKREKQIWDEDGKLIDNSNQMTKNNENQEPKNISKKIRLSTFENSHLYMNQTSGLNKSQVHQEAPQKKVISRKDQNEFDKRQQELIDLKMKQPETPHFQSLMSSGSRKMLKTIKERPDTIIKQNLVDPECTFQPDMSLTKSYRDKKAKGLNVEQAEAREVLKSIDKKSKEIQNEIKDYCGYTFMPKLESDEKMRNNARNLVKERKKMKEMKEDEKEMNTFIYDIKPPQKKSHFKQDNDASKRRKEVLDLLNLFK